MTSYRAHMLTSHGLASHGGGEGTPLSFLDLVSSPHLLPSHTARWSRGWRAGFFHFPLSVSENRIGTKIIGSSFLL